MNYNHTNLILNDLEYISNQFISLNERVNKLRESSLADGSIARAKLEEIAVNLEENIIIVESLVELIKTNEA